MIERDSGIPFERSSPTAAAIESSISHLPEDLREALLLTRTAGLTFVEVAAILDVPEATLRQRVDEARHCIRRFLAEHHDLPLADDAIVTAVDAPRQRRLGDRILGWLQRAASYPVAATGICKPQMAPGSWLQQRAASYPLAAQPVGWRPAMSWLIPALGTGVAVLLLAIALLPPLLPPASDAGPGAAAFEQARREFIEASERALNTFDRAEVSAWCAAERAAEKATAALEHVWDAGALTGSRRPVAISVTAEPQADDLSELASRIRAYNLPAC